MAVWIGETLMTEETSGARATWQRDQDGAGGAWASTRLPGARLTRSQAAASMRLAELETAGYGDSPNAAGIRAELGI
jgi:hypothetical protein